MYVYSEVVTVLSMLSLPHSLLLSVFSPTWGYSSCVPCSLYYILTSRYIFKYSSFFVWKTCISTPVQFCSWSCGENIPILCQCSCIQNAQTWSNTKWVRSCFLITSICSHTSHPLLLAFRRNAIRLHFSEFFHSLYTVHRKLGLT